MKQQFCFTERAGNTDTQRLLEEGFRAVALVDDIDVLLLAL